MNGLALLASLLPGLLGAAVVTVYLILMLSVESQAGIMALLMAGAVAVLAAARTGVLARVGRGFAAREGAMNLIIVVSVLVLTGVFHEDHFLLLLVATILIYVIAALGLNIQFGYAGTLNFAGAAFFGIGCYTAAVLTKNTPLPHLLVLFAGGAMAAIIGNKARNHQGRRK